MIARVDHALEAAARGWRVFPLVPNGKVPLLKTNWREIATVDPATIRHWWAEKPDANIGLATGAASGVSVVDLDVKNGIDGIKSAKDLNLEPTYIIDTPSGGKHHYYRFEPGDRNHAGLLPGVDIRAEGGYVVGPGSQINGKPYQVCFAGDVIEQSDALRKAIARNQAPVTGEAIPDAQAFDVDADEVKRIRAALGYLDPDPYETWLSVGMALYELAGGSKQLFDVWDNWSAGSPKYDASIMRKRWRGFASERPDKITEATLWHMAREHGWTEPPCDLVFVPDADESFIFSGQELREWRGPALGSIELWRGSVLARGNMTLIAGPPKIGKSMLVQHLLMSAASGRDFLGHTFKQPFKVIWLQAEIRKVYMKTNRVEPALKAYGLNAHMLRNFERNFHASDRLDFEITRAADRKILEDVVQQLKPDIIAIDPVINFSSVEENDAQKTKDLLRAARLIAKAGNPNPSDEPALIVVHHTKKVDPQRKNVEPFELIRGSSAFRGYYDSGIVLLPDSSGNVSVHYETRNEKAPNPEGIVFEGGQWRPAALAISRTADGKFTCIESTARDERALAVLKILSSVPEPYTMAAGALNEAVRKECGVSERTARYIVQAALEDPGGLVCTFGGGPARVFYHTIFKDFVQANLTGEVVKK